MKKVVLSLCCLISSTYLFSQQYVFTETSPEAFAELRHLVNDSAKLNHYLLKVESYGREGVYFISTEQYKIIESRINTVNPNPMTEEEIENKFYADKAKKSYRSITTLLK